MPSAASTTEREEATTASVPPAGAQPEQPKRARPTLGTRGRFALGAAATAVVIVVIVLLTAGGSGKTVRKVPPPAKLPPLAKTYANPGMSATGALPSDWTAVRGPGFLRLANADAAAVIVIASVSTASNHNPRLLSSALASIRKTYGTVTIKHGNGATLGGLPGRSIVVYTRNKHGIPIRILLAAALGHHQAYVMEAFTAQRATSHDLVETQQVVNTLRLQG